VTSGRNDISCEIDPWPSHAGQRPPFGVLNENRAWPKPRTCASGVAAKRRRRSSQIPRNVAGTERGVRPIGD
jgi:hypothetical protein